MKKLIQLNKQRKKKKSKLRRKKNYFSKKTIFINKEIDCS